MFFALLLAGEHVPGYHEYPQVNRDGGEGYEVYQLELQDADLLCEHFVDEIYTVVGGVLDCGEVDFYSAQQCARLIPWLQQELGNANLQSRLKELYSVLESMASRAVELNTGIVIEL